MSKKPITSKSKKSKNNNQNNSNPDESDHKYDYKSDILYDVENINDIKDNDEDSQQLQKFRRKKQDNKNDDIDLTEYFEKNSEDKNISEEDVYLICESELDSKGLIDHHVSSMDNFYESGIEQIITKGFPIEITIENENTQTEENKKIAK